jgi:GT2 family glycosyltransferase
VAEALEVEPDAVVVAYVYSRDVTYSFHHSIIELIGYDLAHHARVLRGGYIAYKASTDGLADARNKVVKAFLEEHQADWLLWVDTDMGFAADTLERLLAAADPVERPVVGGLAFTQREEESDGMGGWRCRATPTVFDWAKLDDGQMGFSVRWGYPHDMLTRCAGTGSACILIHRSVFERVEEKYGRSWYDRVPNVSLGQVISEDLSFCLRAGTLNIPVHVHTGVKTSHQKTLWLAEDDYYGQVALSQLPAAQPVAPAAEPVAVVVPVLGRPEHAERFMDSLRATTDMTLATVYAVGQSDDEETLAAWEAAGATVLDSGEQVSFAAKCNLAYAKTGEPWLFLVGSDVRFHPGWLDHAQAAAADGASVIGTNDLGNPRVTSGEHATHLLVRRSYVDEHGASWDDAGVLAHEGYRHWWVDDELVTVAKQRGVWAMALASKVEHLHPAWGKGPMDAVYELGAKYVDQDKRLFEQRLAEHAR